MRILLVYYSQSGDAARIADTLVDSLQAPGIEIERECVRPMQPYPFPWRNVFRFFDVLPECQLGPPPAIHEPKFASDRDYDLIVLVYQVWFLAPSLPIQGFLASPAARVLTGHKVMTVSVSRNMWQSASETMKSRLRQLGAVHMDNLVVTHQGPPWATFVTAPRLLLFGKRNAFWKVFPPAGLGEAELQRVRRIGAAVRERLDRLRRTPPQSLLCGLGAVEVNRRYLIPELIGWYLFRGWAHALQRLGRIGRLPRYVGVGLFMLFLVTLVGMVMPIIVVVSALFYPLGRMATRAYAERLAEPSGSRKDKGERRNEPWRSPDGNAPH
ncbi:MAG TPA: hypothetical protein VN688_21195 [Gemmataceae bacterium]|nr:hypothetical protein [Gemmataceae bacterium]